jgi:hypothetical protein
VEGTTPDLHNLRIEISMTSASPSDRVEAMQQAWLKRCPVYLALRDPNDVDVAFTSV